MKIVQVVGCLALAGLLAGCDSRSDNSGASTTVESGAVSAGRDSNADAASPATVQPDNTGRNVRDRSDATLTPDEQGGSEADRELSAKIRRGIAANDQLSADAKNIKVITVDGKVTLRGPVKDAQEMSAIQNIVQQAGVTSFENQLEVKPAKDE